MKFKDELKKNILTMKTGKVKAEYKPLTIDYDKVSSDLYYDTLEEHKFQVILGRAICCRPEEVDHMRGRVYEELIHYLYGHLRPTLHRLGHEIASQNRGKALELLDEIMEEVSA